MAKVETAAMGDPKRRPDVVWTSPDGRTMPLPSCRAMIHLVDGVQVDVNFDAFETPNLTARVVLLMDGFVNSRSLVGPPRFLLLPHHVSFLLAVFEESAVGINPMVVAANFTALDSDGKESPLGQGSLKATDGSGKWLKLRLVPWRKDMKDTCALEVSVETNASAAKAGERLPFPSILRLDMFAVVIGLSPLQLVPFGS